VKLAPPRLAAPAGATAARLARAQLEAAGRCARRLRKNTDREALHDFRVALRRLRSVLRAYRPWLDDVPKALRRRLRDLARATGEGRDVEVFLDWLGRRPPGAEAVSAPWTQPYLERRRARSYRHIRGALLRDFGALSGRLERVLRAIQAQRVPVVPEGSFAAATADRLRAQTQKLAADLAAIHSLSDSAALHAARIQAKRIRYLLEPLVAVPAVGPAAAVRLLRAFQDDSGLVCDGFARRALLVEAGRAAGEEMLRQGMVAGGESWRSGAEAFTGLIALARASETDTQARFGEFRRRYLGARAMRFERTLGAVARRLARAMMRD
jgi:CHAD domain-containing protein